MNLTLDASVAVKFVVREPGRDKAMTYLPQTTNGTTIIHYALSAPILIQLELHHVLSKLYLRSEISLSQFTAGTHFALEQVKIDALETAIVDLARDISIGANGRFAPASGLQSSGIRPFNIYDCVYVAHARMNGNGLLTADKKQADVARVFNIPVEFIPTE